jgi:hypothetical protein
MFTRLSSWLRRVSTGRIALAALAIFLLFTALVLPGQSAQANTGAEDVGSPDLSLAYSPEDLYRMAEAYGPSGRRAYIRARFTFDVAWPVVYTLFLVTSISWLFGRAFPDNSRWQLANLAPIAGALFDYLENVSTSAVMWRYPDPTPVVDVLAPAFTFIKWIFVGDSFVLLFLGIGAVLWRAVRRRAAGS